MVRAPDQSSSKWRHLLWSSRLNLLSLGLRVATFLTATISVVYFTDAWAASHESAARAMLERVIGAAAASQIRLAIRQDAPAAESFTISGSNGNVLIEATTPSALTQGAGWYLKYVVHADFVLRGRLPSLPATLPGPPEPIHRSASVPHRYAFNDTNDGYTDPYLPWADWENELDLLALHGVNEVHVTVGSDYVYYVLLQHYGYSPAELRRWIPDPSHQPWWVLQNLSGSDPAISEQVLAERAALGRKIADRARELGITPVFPGYWGTVPTDFATRNAGADVVQQREFFGYARPGWLNPASPLFAQVAADYYALSADVLGVSSMYKMDPLHEGGVLGHIDLSAAAAAIEHALQTAHPGATWALLAWIDNPSPALIAGIADKSHLLLLASEADRYPTWDSARRWSDVPYALGSIYNFGGRTIIGANLATIVDRWFTDLAGSNAAQLRGVAMLPESWTSNPVAAELMSELPWHATRFVLDDWLRAYAQGRYGTLDAHASAAWSMLGATAYSTLPDGTGEGNDSLFNARPALDVTAVTCCAYGRMRYSRPDLERAWQELLLVAPSAKQSFNYRFDLTDLTRQVIVNRARALLPLIRRAYEVRNEAQFGILTRRWLALMDLADQVEGSHEAFMLGPRIDHARGSGATPDEQATRVRNAVRLVTNWGTREGSEAGLHDYANRDWNCLTRTYYRVRWETFFDDLRRQLAGLPATVTDWFALGEDFANADLSACASTPTSDIVEIADDVRVALASGPDASIVPQGLSSYADNEAVFAFDGTSYRIDSAGANAWRNANRYGVLYQRGALHDGTSATVRVTSMLSEGRREWARAGLMAATDVVAAQPRGFVNIAITPGHGCVFSWAADTTEGLARATSIDGFTPPGWVRLSRVGDTYVGSCSVDGVHWSIAGSASPSDLGITADIGMFASAVNGGGADRLVASFDDFGITSRTATGDRQIAIEYYHAGFGHYFVTPLSDEIAKLDAGLFEGWRRTGLGYAVFTTAAPDRVPVCRFFTIAFAPKSSHFYGPRGFGCEGALANADWLFEGEVFYTPLPGPTGSCPVGTTPIYRLYNNGQGGAPNHRFTTDIDVRTAMLVAGHVPEGSGIGIGMCSPQ